MYFILPDRPVTRRQRAHFILDEDNRELYSSPNLMDCIRWLRDHNEYSMVIADDMDQYKFDLVPF
jgi:hypothetical protein